MRGNIGYFIHEKHLIRRNELDKVLFNRIKPISGMEGRVHFTIPDRFREIVAQNWQNDFRRLITHPESSPG